MITLLSPSIHTVIAFSDADTSFHLDVRDLKPLRHIS